MNRRNRYDRKSFQKDAHRINHHIRVPNVRLIDDEGEQLGIVETPKALSIAQDKGLDLVEVAPNSKPPVCKILDYGKFKYQEQKKKAEAKKNRVQISLKEIRVRYRTDSGDLETKLNRARQFLAEGDKVKFSMRFRGREIVYGELGQKVLVNIAKSLKDVAEIDERGPLNARQIYIVFKPIKKIVT